MIRQSERITKSLIQMLLNAEVTAIIHILMQCDIIDESERLPTMGVMFTGRTHKFGYNANFLNEVDDLELRGVLLHEAIHIMLKHCIRIRGRKPDLWNEAADHCVNLMLVASPQYQRTFRLPGEFYCDEQYKDMSVDEIYEKLAQKSGQKSKQLSGKGTGGGKGKPAKGNMLGEIEMPVNNKGDELSDSEAKKAENAITVMVQQAAAIAKKRCGSLGGLSKLLIEAIESKKVDWAHILRNYMTKVTKKDYTYRKPNRRNLERGIITPTLDGQALEDVYIFVDVSGSVSDAELAIAAGEISSILEDYNCSVHVMCGDTKVNSIQSYDQSDLPIKLESTGRGGTDFAFISKFIDENELRPLILVIISDGDVCSFGEEQVYPQVMLTYNKNHRKYPDWLEHIVM